MFVKSISKSLKDNTRIPIGIVTGVAAINLLLAMVAFLKDIAFAGYMGTTEQADALLLAFFIPDTIGNNLVGASISVACVPFFAVLFADGQMSRLKSCLWSIIAFMGVCLTVVCIFFYSFRAQCIALLGNGFTSSTAELCSHLTVYMLPAMLMLMFANIGASVLQVVGSFKTSALIPVLYNIVFLSGILLCAFGSLPIDRGVYIVTLSILAGVIMEFIYAAHFLAKKGMGISWTELLKKPHQQAFQEWETVREIMRVFGSYMIVLLSTQIVLSIERYLASGLEPGTVSGLNYAFRLAQFPYWVFISAISVVILPSMSKAAGLDNNKDVIHIFRKTIEYVFIIATPLCICFFILNAPLVSILLKRGAFDENSLRITSGILAGYSLTILSQGVSAVCLRVFLAMRRMKKPIWASGIGAVVTILADIALVRIFGSQGLGLGAAAGAAANALLMVCFVKKELGGGVFPFKKVGRTLAANIPVVIVSFILLWLWNQIGNCPFHYKILYGMASGICVSAFYLLSLHICKVEKCNI